MQRAVLCILVIMTVNALSADTLQRLRRTKELNFTFYYEHRYPEPQQFQISLEFSMKTNNLSLGLETLHTSFNAISTLAKKYNATFVSDPIEEKQIEQVEIQKVSKYSIYSIFLLQVAPQLVILNDFLGELVNLDQAYHTKLVFIERASSKEVDQAAEEAKALAGASIRSKEICEKYLNMKLRKIQIFEKFIEDQANDTLEQEKGLVGNFLQVVSQAEEQQLDQSAVPLNQFYLCQIVCENNIHFDASSKKINPKLAQQKASQKTSPSQQKQKSAKPSSKPLKKGKSINPDKYQRNREDQL